MDNRQLDEGAFLYVIFTFQVCALAMGVPVLLSSCLSAEKRASLSKVSWLIKLTVLGFVGKWTVETYDLVSEQASRDSSELFDPYQLLQIPNDGSFNTKEIKNAYKRLAKKYHPDVATDVVDEEKAQRRWLNLRKAYETLTKQEKYNNFLMYGDPEGSVAVRALQLALPSWLAGENAQVLLLVAFFAVIVMTILALRVWVVNNASNNESGISVTSQQNLREFLAAILIDNTKAQRTTGLTDSDIVELYEQATEVQTFQEELNKKTTFVEIINALLRRTKDLARNVDKPLAPEIAENAHVVTSLVPRLNETLFEILGEAPFQGTGMIMTPGGGFRFSGEQIITSLVGFSLRLLGGKVEPEHKVSLNCYVDGIDPNDSIRAGDLLTIDATCERLHDGVSASQVEGKQSSGRAWMALVNTSTDQVVLEEISLDEKVTKRSFKMMLR